MKKIRIYLLIGALLSFTLVKVNAQAKVINKVKDYVTTNVSPVMTPLRYDFDKKLTNNEIYQIENIRKELKNVSKVRQEAGITLGSGSLLHENLTDKQIETIQITRKKIYKAILQAMIIADNHEKDLEEIFKQQNVNKDQWVSDIKTIISENTGNKLNPYLRNNLKRMTSAENLINVLFVIWRPNDQLLSYL